jgi:hypothetical protein
VVRARGLRVGNPNDAAAIEQAFLAFRKHHQDFLAPEAQYFVDIAKSDDFVVRYWEVIRNIQAYAKDMCRGRNAFLIVGPEYLYQIASQKASFFWWPSNKNEILDLLRDFSSDTNFVFDMDLMPSWIGGKGFVRHSDCLKPLN